MKFSQVPEPARIARLPHDDRGYPVPIAVPREDGRPLFAAISAPRKMLLGHWGLCAVCGLPFADNELRWLPGDADGLERRQAHLAAAQRGARVVIGGSVEAPVHEICATYAAMTCPYLLGPNARRQNATTQAGMTIPVGDRRGDQGVLHGYEAAEMVIDLDSGPSFDMVNPREMRVYTDGAEFIDTLTALSAAEPDPDALVAATPQLAVRWEELIRVRDDAELGPLVGQVLDEAADGQLYGIRRARGPRTRSVADVEAGERAEARELAARGAFDGLHKSAPCPCGSGRRAKHCHGRYLPA